MSREFLVPSIYTVRNEPVVLDTDLAAIYRVKTGQFNRAIKRNAARFPKDFAFQLSKDEWDSLRCQIGTLKQPSRGRHRKYRPWVFSEHGAIMAATLLNSPRAVAMSVGACPERRRRVVRAFVKMRRALLADATLETRLQKIEKTLLTHDAGLRDLYQKLKPLLLPPPEKPRRRIGFHSEGEPG